MNGKKPKSLNESAEEFHAAMGRSIAIWAIADQMLFEIFQYCVGPPKQCAIIFYKQPGLEQRLTLTTEIVLALLPQPERKDGGHAHPDAKAWKNIDEQFRDLLSVRRRIAHQQVRAEHILSPVGKAPWYLDQQAAIETVTTFSFGVLPGYGEQLRGRGNHTPIKLNDLARHETEVLRLVQALFRFGRRELRKHVPASSQPSSPQKPPT